MGFSWDRIRETHRSKEGACPETKLPAMDVPLNRIRNELRRKGREPAATDLDGIDVESLESPLEHAIGREAVERYERALQGLKAEEQEAIIGRVEMGYSYEELAEALGKPTPDAARKTAHRAPVRLADEMNRAAG